MLLDDVDRRGIYLAEGLGHAFMSLADGSTVVYLCSTGYAPGREHGIHPLDPAIGIEWPTTGRDGSPIEPLLSDKDAAAPTLGEATRSRRCCRTRSPSRELIRWTRLTVDGSRPATAASNRSTEKSVARCCAGRGESTALGRVGDQPRGQA